ncbi:MAG TPA: hypothetical protein VFC19_09065 [Candidatus Limnocylindrales bacterium]|nr:hypothetical protein [Candidatus Limnocylindrales bacterium]
MAGVPDPEFLSVEGPEFAERVRVAAEITNQLEQQNWDFNAAPEVFAREAACDVAAKEIVTTFDGRVQTRYGRLVMKGAGARFNLLSHESPRAAFLGVRPDVFAEVNVQVGSAGLLDFPEFARMSPLQRVELFNPNVFYQLRDVVFWSVLYQSGLFPTGFEDIGRQISSGNVIRNLLFAPSVPSSNGRQELFMEAFSAVQFPTDVVEWMPKPLFGGMSTESLHIDTLLTLDPTDLSHPYLDLVAEGKVVFQDRSYYMRRFAGISPKDATRGPGVPAEERTH